MKIKKITNQKTRLINLKLLKAKIYSKKKTQNCTSIKNIKLKLKKALHIIYKFHITNKKIIFIGTSFKTNTQIKNLLKKTKHNFIPESTWTNGIITNQAYTFKHLFKKYVINNEKNYKFLFNLKNKNDLIIVLNKSQNKNLLEECLNNRIPTISLNDNLNTLNNNLSTYKINGNFVSDYQKTKNNLFYSILSATFKKAIKFEQKKIIKLNNKNALFKKK